MENDVTTMKSAQAASEIKPVMQPAYISKFMGRSKDSSAGKNSVNNMEEKRSEPWWTQHEHPQSVGWRKFARHAKESQETSQQPEGSLRQQVTSQNLPSFDPNQNANLPVETDTIKITTIIETIRRRVPRSARTAEEAKYIQGIIAKKRSKRSLHDSEVDAMAAESSRRDRVQRAGFPTTRTRAADARNLKAASSTSIPSTVFYKRIWEYINGTRPHSDIVSDYSALENDTNEAGKSTCDDKDPVSVSQSQKGELRAAGSTVKPERELYKRIWDIINSTSGGNDRTTSGKGTRSKRDANIPIGDTFAATTGRSCVSEREADREGDKQRQTTNDEAKEFDHADEDTQSRKVFATDPYTSGFWTVVNKEAQWQPETAIPTAISSALPSEPILSPRANVANEAAEAADLNRLLSPVQSDIDEDSSENDSTDRRASEKTRGNKPQDLTEPGPPYPSGRENSTDSSFSPGIADTIDKTSRKDDRAEYVEQNETTTAGPLYDPANIPYVEVPDYSDRRDDALEKNNHSASAVGYEDYDDDGDYVDPESSYRADNISFLPSAGIQSLPDTRIGSDERESSVDANVRRCAERQENSAKCVADQRDARDHSEDDTSSLPASRSPDGPAAEDPSRPTEREDSVEDFATVPFDINEYKKPFDLEEFLKNEPTLERAGGAASETKTKHEDDRENPSRDDDAKESEKSDRDDESAEYNAYPKGGWYNYFAKDSDLHDDKDETEEEDSDSRAQKEATSSEAISKDYNSRDDRDFLRHIFEKDNGEESRSDVVGTEDEFLSRYFTEDVLRQLRENSTDAEDRKLEESRNREDVQKTLSTILDKKDRFSRLDENLDKMVEEGEAVPIRYNNFWSLEYESPRRKNNSGEEEEEEEKKEEEEEA